VIGLPSLFDKFGLVRWAIQQLRILAAWRRKIKQKDGEWRIVDGEKRIGFCTVYGYLKEGHCR